MRTVVRRDRRGLGLVLTAAAVLLGGAWLANLEPTHPAEPLVQERGDLRRHFDAAVLLLHSRQYRDAQASLQRVLELAPQLPEAHANMGFALLGLQQAAPAREAFERAIALKADQANAYYGLALAHEAGGDLELALGAMRSYLHLARSESEEHLRRARAAVWEWESQIGQRRGVGKP